MLGLARDTESSLKTLTASRWCGPTYRGKIEKWKNGKLCDMLMSALPFFPAFIPKIPCKILEKWKFRTWKGPFHSAVLPLVLLKCDPSGCKLGCVVTLSPRVISSFYFLSEEDRMLYFLGCQHLPCDQLSEDGHAEVSFWGFTSHVLHTRTLQGVPVFINMRRIFVRIVVQLIVGFGFLWADCRM